MKRIHRALALTATCVVAVAMHLSGYAYEQRVIRVGGLETMPDNLVLW